MNICIDPGHGGEDPGALGQFAAKKLFNPVENITYQEKNVNLAASLMLASILQFYGQKIVLTRIDDETLSVEDRVFEANDLMTSIDLFVSIHCNSFTTPEPRGFEVWHCPGSVKGESIATKIVAMVEQLQTMELRKSPVRAANFYILRYTSMPAVLLELAFMSNYHDLSILTNMNELFILIQHVSEAILRHAEDILRGT